MEVICPKCRKLYSLSPHRISGGETRAVCGCGHRFILKKPSAGNEKVNRESGNVNYSTVNKDNASKQEQSARYVNSDDYRVSDEKSTLYWSLGGLTLLLLFFAGVSFGLILILICISAIWVKFRQGHLLGQAIKVSEVQLPKIYSAAQIAAKRLSMTIPDVFVKQDPVINAYALGFLGRKSVVLHSATVEFMTDEELMFILGHEFSHIKCDHTNWMVITNSIEGVKIPIISDIMGWILHAWSRKAEYTCDRGGMLASRDLKASVCALAKVAVGNALFRQLNIESFSQQPTGGIAWLAEKLSTHPYIVNRIQAMSRYCESDNYKSIVGEILNNSHTQENSSFAEPEERAEEHDTLSNESSGQTNDHLKSGWLRCPECLHIQKYRESCEYCGTSLTNARTIKEPKQSVQEAERIAKESEEDTVKTSPINAEKRSQPGISKEGKVWICVLAGVILFSLVAFVFFNLHSWPEEARNEFLATCTLTSGGNRSVCKCLLRKLERKYRDPQDVWIIFTQPDELDTMIGA